MSTTTAQRRPAHLRSCALLAPFNLCPIGCVIEGGHFGMKGQNAFAAHPLHPQPRLEQTARVASAAFRHEPAYGQAIFGDVRLAKTKFRAWMRFKGYELPTFLCDLPQPADRSHVESADDSHAKAPRGRPRKPGWMRVEQPIREMHVANPEMPLGTLALDACKQAAAEYPKRDLPSWETVLRMKTILAESRPPVP